MKRVTPRELRDDCAAGEDLQMGGRKRVIARLLSPDEAAQGRRSGFLTRLKKIYGDKRLTPTGAELLSRERRRY